MLCTIVLMLFSLNFKAIRLTAKVSTCDDIYDLLDHLVPHVYRFSDICCLHIALVGTTLQVFHEKSLKVVAKKLLPSLTDTDAIRLKDLERLLLAMTMFDYDPKTSPDIFYTIYEELHGDKRVSEKVKYPRIVATMLSYLSMRNVYSHELLNQLLDDDMVTEVYGTLFLIFLYYVFSKY